MDTDIYRKFDKDCLKLRNYLRIAAVFVLTFGASVFLFSPSAEADGEVYYLKNTQRNSGNWSSENYWWNDNTTPSTTTIPDNVNGCKFVVGGEDSVNNGFWLRSPQQGNGKTDIFEKSGSGAENSLYLGYTIDSNGQPYCDPNSDVNIAVLNVKCQTIKIKQLYLGNGAIYQGNNLNVPIVVQGAITIDGKAYITVHNDETDTEQHTGDTRRITIESSLSGNGTLNLFTNYKTTTQIGIYLAPEESSRFTGKVVINDKSRVAFEKENVFANASSITSDGYLTLNANQTFKNLSGDSGSISIDDNVVLTLNNASDATYGGSISGTGSLVKTGAGTLTIPGALNYTGDTTISSGTLNLSGSVHLYNLTGSGNLVYSSPDESNFLKLEYDSNKTFGGVISGTGSVEKLGSGNLTLTQALNIGPTNIAAENLILEAGGTLCNLSGSGSLTNNGSQALTINYYSDMRWSNKTYSGNITNNSSQALTINYYSDRTNSGDITSNSSQVTINVGSGITATDSGKISSTGATLVKTGAGTLKLTSTVDQSINCNVVIDGGTILLENQIDGKDRFGDGKTVTINDGGTLECNGVDSFGNGNASTSASAHVTVKINKGGTLKLSSNNQTLMRKTIELTGGKILGASSSEGIHVKVGTSFTATASDDPLAIYPTVSEISVPIKIRNVQGNNKPDPLKITVVKNAQLIFSSYIWNDNPNAMGINKTGAGILTFDYTKHSSRTYKRPITVSEGVLELKNGALATDGTIQINSSTTLELYVDKNEIKKMTIDNVNKIFGTEQYGIGKITKTGDGTLKIFTAASGLVSAESLVVSSGRLDAKGYISGKLSVAADAMLSPGNSIGSLWIEDFIIGETTYSGELILNETGSKLLMEIGGPTINNNDLLVASGNLTLHDGSIIQLAATDDCTLQDGEEFTAVLHGANSSTIKNDFISKYVRSSDFNNLEYVQLTSGAYSGMYAITGRRYIDPNAVPEPSTWALLILGVAGLLYLRTRKNSKS